ncbi:expressed unknown protein [Seminavis robusta]|uniref:Uncharacterized protein n=1 Tax=Seminavis robusta TaxID=568900 RepID=A0A9N8DFY6_9STRA|nr:expressed unknown protein [Seminavis robusta]|eukprot:Sro139_g064920.1 n/a (187) ;mRNA; r:3394-3954
MEQAERTVRSDYCCHLMVPGKKQAAPVSLVAKTYREALPALAWLMEHITGQQMSGRVHRNVKDDRDQVLEGTFPNDPAGDDGLPLPYWLFQSTGWSVLACSLIPAGGDNQNPSEGQDRAVVLQTSIDNLVFRLGKEAIGNLDIFVDPYGEYSFAVGDPNQAETVRQETTTAFQKNNAHTDEAPANP